MVYVINAAIAYLSYLEAKRVGQVSLAWVGAKARMFLSMMQGFERG